MAITVYTYNDKVLKNVATDKWLKKAEVDPYNPLGLPPYTIRIQVKPGTHLVQATPKGTITAVQGQSDVYDVCTAGLSNPGNWDSLLFGGEDFDADWNPVAVDSNVVSILGANSTGVTNMYGLCCYCVSLETVSLFDTSAVTNASNMFTMAFSDSIIFGSELINIPDFNFTDLTNAYKMFYGCRKVESGALTLYNRLNSLGAQITNHGQCFRYCGSNTTTGAAELAQIPSGWK